MVLIFAAMVVASFAGCSGGTKLDTEATADDTSARCASFAEAYARCQSKLGAPEPAVSQRVGSTRSSLIAHGAGTKNGLERAQLGNKCDESLKQLRALCP